MEAQRKGTKYRRLNPGEKTPQTSSQREKYGRLEAPRHQEHQAFPNFMQDLLKEKP
jgi:hypothetical protein